MSLESHNLRDLPHLNNSRFYFRKHWVEMRSSCYLFVAGASQQGWEGPGQPCDLGTALRKQEGERLRFLKLALGAAEATHRICTS